MRTGLTIVAALLLAGVSRAALAQEHEHDHGDRPQVVDHGGGNHGAGAPSAVPAPQPRAPVEGHARFGAPPPPGAGPAPAAAPGPAVPAQHGGGGDRHWNGERHDGGDRHDGGARPNGFAPGGTANGDHRWDRTDVPREVTPPRPGEHGWDRPHDGHDGDPRQLQHDARAWDHNADHRDGGHGDWNRDHRDGDARNGDHRGPPANWRRWERGQFPSVYSSPHRYRVGGYRQPYGYFVRSWAFGDYLPSGWFGPGYWIDDFYDYDLPYPPPGYHWVRVGGDVLLVDDYSGRIVQVIRDMFW